MSNRRSLATLISITFSSSCLFFLLVLLVCSAKAWEANAEEPTKPEWQYVPELLRPFWQGNIMEGESVLFMKDPKTGEARASVLFPVEQVLAVRNSAGDVTYENGRDYAWKPESREIVLPAGSQHDLFPQYRDALASLCRPGVALADLTSIWAGFLELKQDWDQTGNGVNHPNDFGHRVYAQVLLTLLDPNAETEAALPVTAAKPREIKVRRTENQIRYGLIGEVGKTPAPTLFVLAHGIEDMQREPVYTEIAGILSQQGWLSVVIDPPCHGEDVRPGEPAQLQGWRHRLEHDEEFVAAFNAKVRDVLDALVKDKVTDPERVAACGISRGGFLAYHLAAAEPRIKAVAGISPVTNLLALREFADTSQRKKFEQLDVRRLAPKLAGRAVWLSIGNNDTRVNTDDAIAFTREVVRATARPNLPDTVIPVELLVAPTAGHSKIDQAHELLAAWLVNQFSPAKPTP